MATTTVEKPTATATQLGQIQAPKTVLSTQTTTILSNQDRFQKSTQKHTDSTPWIRGISGATALAGVGIMAVKAAGLWSVLQGIVAIHALNAPFVLPAALSILSMSPAAGPALLVAGAVGILATTKKGKAAISAFKRAVQEELVSKSEKIVDPASLIHQAVQVQQASTSKENLQRVHQMLGGINLPPDGETRQAVDTAMKSLQQAMERSESVARERQEALLARLHNPDSKQRVAQSLGLGSAPQANEQKTEEPKAK